MSVDASSLAPSVDAVAMAITDCCADIIEQRNEVAQALGDGIAQGLAAIAAGNVSCCTQQIAANTVVIPPSTTTAPDGTVMTVGGFTGPSWAYQYFAYQQAAATQSAAYTSVGTLQVTTWQEEYQTYLEQEEEWRQNQIVPIILSLLANLALVLEQLGLYNDMLECTIELLDCVKEEVAALKDLSIGTLIPAVATHTDELTAKFSSGAALTAICDQRDGIQARATTMWNCFENTYKPELTQYLPQFDAHMFDNSAVGSEEQANLQAINAQMLACFETYLKVEDEETAPVIGAAIRQMANKVDEACNWLTDCSEKLGGHWDTYYAQKDGDYACAAMESATASLDGIQAVRTFLQGCRDTWKAIHDTVYHAGEAAHVPMLHQAAMDTVGKFDEIAQCAFGCSEEEKARYAATYEAKEASLSNLAMSEACNLHPCFAEIKDWLVEHSDNLQACWEGGWKPKEFDYACQILDKGLELMCRVEEDLEEFCEDVQCFKDHWSRCYEQAECLTSPKIIMAGVAACEKQESTYGQICDYMEHLWDKFEQTWCPWDAQDAQYFCDFWLKTNPLNELCDNHECQQDMADLLKECYEDLVLPWEKAYIREICEMEKYVPKYCETSDAAQLAIISQTEKQLEQAIKANPRYCSGASKQQQINIRTAGIRAQAAAMATANRDERWWEVEECDRRHRYTMDVLERLGKRFPDHALQFYGASSTIMDGILARMHERLLRGYEYVRNTNDYSRTVLNANQAAVEAAERAIQLGHFYPDAFIRGKNTYFQSSLSYMDDVQDVMRIGQFYPELASQDRERAMNSVDRSANWGFQHMQHGIRHIQTALDAKTVAANTAQSAQSNALQSYGIGQDYLRIALAAAEEDSQQTNLATQAASNAQRTGLGYAQTAADKMQAVLQGALTAIREGNSLMSNNRLYLGQLQNGYNSATGNGIASMGQFLGAQELGLRAGQISGQADQVSLAAAIDGMQSTCDFLSRNHCCTASVAGQSSGGALDTATGLLSGAAQGITSGVDGFIGSLAALNQPPSPPSVPFGNTGSFGTVGAPLSGGSNGGFTGGFGTI